MLETRSYSIRAFALVFCLTLCGPAVTVAQEKDGQKQPDLKTTRVPKPAEQRLAKLVLDELEALPDYTVFDYLAFQIEGSTVELTGQVCRPDLKSDTENAIKKLEGVEDVLNHIQVLPVSNTDDHIRRSVYRAIYQHPTLAKYAIQAVPPIHIIVKDGKVALEGMVTNELDKSIAGVQANSVSGISAITNNLHVEKSN
jgi:hyperosmotically inducible protein